jgi:hypothetical protein
MHIRELLTVINSSSDARYVVGNTALVTKDNVPTSDIAKAENCDKFVVMSYRQLEQIPNVQVLDVGSVYGTHGTMLKITVDITDESLAIYK